MIIILWLDQFTDCYDAHIVGIATRLCLSTGVWDVVDTSDCMRQDFVEIQTEVRTNLLTGTST